MSLCCFYAMVSNDNKKWPEKQEKDVSHFQYPDY